MFPHVEYDLTTGVEERAVDSMKVHKYAIKIILMCVDSSSHCRNQTFMEKGRFGVTNESVVILVMGTVRPHTRPPEDQMDSRRMLRTHILGSVI